MTDKTFDVMPGALRSAASSIQTEQGTFQRSTQTFSDGARELSAGQGYLDAYNDVIQDVLRATEDAISAFDALVTNLGERAGSLNITANNYERAQEAATRRYNGLGP
ncbi:MAG: hypothetical protein ACRD2C_24000 [Acidimicrobiales bacterium]